MSCENVEKLSLSEENGIKAAMLLSAGVLMGLGMKNKHVRRLTGFACAALTAGLAIPLAQTYLDRKKESEGDLIHMRVEGTDAPEDEPVFQFREEPIQPEAPEAPEVSVASEVPEVPEAPTAPEAPDPTDDADAPCP